MEKSYKMHFLVVADPQDADDPNHRTRCLHGLKSVPELEDFSWMQMDRDGSFQFNGISAEEIIKRVNTTFGRGPLTARFATAAELSLAVDRQNGSPSTVIVIDTRKSRDFH